MKPMRLTLFAAVAVLTGAGCDKSAAPASRPTVPYSLTSQTVAHFHWRGKSRLAAATNAAGLMRIWNQAESAALETQVLDKLSTAPWRLLPRVATTNFTAAAPLLRSLLDDCVQQESYLEVRAATNQPGELAFAIHLPAGRAAVWETNLAVVLESLTGLGTIPYQLSAPNSQLVHGWSLKKHETPNHLELARVGEWVVVGVGQDQNALFGDFVARILRDHTPLLNASADFWLDAEVDLRRVTEAFKLDWHLPEGLPKISVQAVGDGQNVQTHGTLDFPRPLELVLEPWNLPTNLVRGHLGSFTAVRGFAPWLGAQKTWTDLQLGPAPDQFFLWAGQGVPMQTFFAAPVPAATNRLGQITDTLMQETEPWLEAHRSGHLERPAEFEGVSWVGMPFLSPYLRSAGDFIYGGFFPNDFGRMSLPPDMIFALSRTNTVYYDWEITSPRIEAWFYLGQTLRLVLHKAQLPADSVSAAWLVAQTNTLGNCVTTVFQTGPEQLSLVRRSSLGFTAFELHLLADWLESPQFPLGLNTLLQPETLRDRKRPPQTVPPQ